jgi:putative membrane protein
MLISALIAFAHHLCAFAIAAALVVELISLRGELTLERARRLVRFDAIYGIAAMTIIVVGVARVVWFEKSPGYYLHSAPFIAKMILFAAIGLLSIRPTVTFLSWRGALAQDRVPALAADAQRRLRSIVHLELGLLALVILCAALMAKGIGFFGE